jgi:hypothetical protein
MVFDVTDVQVLAAHIAGVEDIEQVGDDSGDRLPAGQRLVPQVIDVPAFGVGSDQGFRDFGQAFLRRMSVAMV